MAWAIGVDLGGTHVMAAPIDDRGKIRERFEYQLKSHDFDYVVDRITAAAFRDVLRLPLTLDSPPMRRW